MAMTPEEIEDKKFLVGLRGYDRDEVRKFLASVADDYRTVLADESKSRAGANGSSDAARSDTESTIATAKPSQRNQPAASKATPRSAESAEPQDWARMGEEVAAVLRTAHEQVAALKQKAQDEASAHKASVEAQAGRTRASAEKYESERRAKAEKYETDLRAKAEEAAEARKRQADAELEQAKRTLANAQDEALSLVADAEKRAKRMLQTTERKARSKADEVLSQARAELAELTASQEQASQWLENARTYIGEAIGSFRSAPKSDLSEPPEVSDEPNDAPDAGSEETSAEASPAGHDEAIDHLSPGA